MRARLAWAISRPDDPGISRTSRGWRPRTTAHRFIHDYDIIFCEEGARNHNGAKPTFEVAERDVDAEQGAGEYRIVTEEDQRKVTLHGCSSGKPTKIASILAGRAKDVKLKGQTPLLVNLVAIEAGTGHVVRVASSYAERMAGHEGKKKHVYLDTKGLKTVGIGFNMDKAGAKTHFDSALWLPSTSTLFDGLSPDPQATLTELQANTGNVAGFPKMVNAIKSGDMEKASYELMHGASGRPSKLVGDVGAGRANNYAASLRWNVNGAPEASPLDPANAVDSPVGPSFDPEGMA